MFTDHSSTATQERQHTSRVKNNGQNGDNRSNPVKKTQPKQEDVLFAQIIKRIRSSGKPVLDYGDIGSWKSAVEGLNQAAESDQINEAIDALLKSYPRLAKVFSTIPTDEQTQAAEQEQEDKRFTKDATGRNLLRLWSIEDIYQTPDAEYLISHILEEASVSLLYGVSGTGKTFTALHTGLCVAHGETWHRRKVKQGIVWYINTEGARGLKKRLKAWYMQYPYNEPSQSFKVIPWSLDLREHFPDLLYTIEREQQKPALVIIDNFSMCTPGINQNLQEEVAPVLRLLNRLAQEQQCHVMVVHHTNKVGDFNGAMAFRNHVDTMIELRKEDRADKDSAILFTCQKARDDEPFRDIKTELKVVSLGINQVSHEEITSCVVVESSEPIKQEGLKDTEQNILDILGDATYSNSDWKKEAMSELHIAKATFDRAVKELVAKGYVSKVRVDGKKYEQYRKVAAAEQEESPVAESEGVHE